MGVKEVQDNLSVVEEVMGDAADTDKGELDGAVRVTREVQEAFQQDDQLKNLPITIYEAEGYLVLDGHVTDTEAKRRIDKLLHSLMEEYGEELVAVENKIRVT